MARLPASATRLGALLAERSGVRFEWGTNDCCLFAADAVQAQLGVDPAEPLRGRYASALQAARVLHLAGGLEGIGHQVLGPPLRAALLACQGDVGLLHEETSARDMLAVCTGAHWAVPTARGLGLMPLDSARMAWRVGCG